MMKSWIKFSDTGWQVGWIRNTSAPRTLSAILTSYSPSAKRVIRMAATGSPSTSPILRASSGLASPESSFRAPGCRGAPSGVSGRVSLTRSPTLGWAISWPPLACRPSRCVAPGADFRVLDLGVGADMNAFGQFGPRSQPAERPDRDVRGDRDLFQVRALDPASIADLRIADLRHGADHAVLTNYALAGERAERMDHGVLADAHVRVDERRPGVRDRDAAGHQVIQDALAHDVLGLRQLPPVVDAQDFTRVLDGHGVDLALDQPDDVREVILVGPVLVLELL